MAIDVIVNAIAAALSTGAIAAATDVGKNAVADAYNGLKNLIHKRFGHDSEAAAAVDKLEAKPDSEGRKQMLSEELESAGAGSDEELISAAQALLALIQSLPQGEKHIQSATGTNIAQADRGGTATVTNYAPPPKA